jgi:hypothetical protein
MQDSIGVQAGYMDLYISSLHDVPAEVYWNIKMAASPSTSGRIDELEVRFYDYFFYILVHFCPK